METYVTYLPDGSLDGCFIQEPPEEHADRMIPVEPAVALNWCTYRANEARDGVELAPPAPAAPPEVLDYTAAVQAMLDAKPKERRYDGILSACTYATSTVPRFKAEGQACVEWRDAVWARCYQLMADVEVGKMPRPTVDELLAMLPELMWPE
ncbi:hypothetical protein HH212_26130 [Massilia forsythiae]|uniref:Uncharacterized protein n=1 Tax=Massilia forsythiae TaxID=2728020 RepID=A0A7Z2W229_9BURK|nr:hypothetical protein [Massilia forsythiae]QJE03037.1 hypothetical protein HH212_26130 [Massilia forsythiae]